MWGDALLVAPKIMAPETVLKEMQMQQVDFYLPASEIWYNYDTKVVNDVTGVWQSALLTDLQQQTFAKGGQILPILLHPECMSVLSCINNPIRVEVYLNEDSQASGSLYLDDGESLDYTFAAKASTNVSLSYRDNALFLEAPSNGYEFPAEQRVTSVAIYGVKSAPALVTGGGIEVPFVYDSAT